MAEERAKDFLNFDWRAAPDLKEVFDGVERQHDDDDDASARSNEQNVDRVGVFKSKQLTKKELQFAFERPSAIVFKGCPVANERHVGKAAS